MLRVPFLYVITTILCCTAQAQQYVDLAKFDYTITPPNVFDSSTLSTPMQEINADVTVPIQFGENNAFLTGLTYENTQASFDRGRRTESVTGVTLKLGLKLQHNERWSGTYLMLPKVSSDFGPLTSRDFQLGGAVLMKYTKSERFNYKFGGYYNQELFGPFFVPIFGFYYLSENEKFEAKALLPLSVGLNYNFVGNFSVGLTYRGQIRSYDMTQSYGAEEERYLARSTNEAYAFVQYALSNGIHFQIHGGHSIGRNYRVYNEKVPFSMPLFYFNDDRTQLNTDFSDGWLLKVAAFYRLKL
ncbi:DUF6268 family outer membrane beta-barrel protein [Crocinitomicaceae bacterium]|nr:DUF6268 family outer membrane beta-barrel protein [Crocinitomicaceae bacterium]